MFDPVQVQYDLTGLLLCYAPLAAVQVKCYRRMRLARELDYRTALCTPRDPVLNQAGAGVFVMQPKAMDRQPDVTGPVLDWYFPVNCVEMPAVNMVPPPVNPDGTPTGAPGGTMVQAEQLGQMVMDCLHLYGDDGVGTFNLDGMAYGPMSGRDLLPGCAGFQVSVHVLGKASQTPRCSVVQVSVAGHVATLSCATAGSTVYYTLDGSFPGTPAVQAASREILTSQAYTAPFAVSAGQTLRCIAWAPGYNNSPARTKPIT
jgi:hypothetical protein